ncbi:unnamed protein product [Sphagnum jensenii]|uniref:RmlD-like substrate binding domain-containing protein n=1 Tax=Sphagnum jensenii TaxID=128206 RepID=A0ABP0XDY0_9BRYO
MEDGKSDLVVVVGGSGYLGLHLLAELAKCQAHKYRVAYTYHSQPPSPQLQQHLPNVKSFQVDLVSGHGLDSISSALGFPRVVVNCAALSNPRACEQNPNVAMAINVPRTVVEWLTSMNAPTLPLLIHLSTDQVYEGIKSFYTEDDETKPVNVYGRSKVVAEIYVKSNYANYAILRSSIIYGPQPFIPLPKTLPLQWIDGVLSGGGEGEFFCDEFRCPIYVKDVVNVIELLIAKSIATEGSHMHLVLNLGGPDKVSRADMADVVAEVQGYNKEFVKRVSALSVNRGVASPSDISMDIRNLVAEVGINLTSFVTGVALTLHLTPSSLE